jgi:hypothetical protein
VQVCALFEQAINAEGSDVDLDQVAAAAMAAVEGAVKDEVEAAAVVSATQTAIAETLKSLQAISGQPAEEAVAELTAALSSTDGAASLASTDAAKGGAAAPAVDPIQLLDTLTGTAAAGAGGSALLQSVDGKSLAGTPSGNGTPSSSVPPSTAASPSPTPPATIPAAYADQTKAKKAAAKAKLVKACMFAVAVALAVSAIKSPAGEVRGTTLAA